MKYFKVEINYGRKCPAFETQVHAVSKTDAEQQAKRLAVLSGWPEVCKKITVKG